MKTILGLDLGTTSIGWAFVEEAEKEGEKSSIKKLGVRIIPLSSDEEIDFQKGKAASINQNRTLKRGARRNLDRYQSRRKYLLKTLVENKIISNNFILSEEGEKTTFSSYKSRAKAASEKVSLEEFAKALFMINKKRGYKSSRKTKVEEDGNAIDGMEVAKFIYENELTVGQYIYKILKEGKKYIPEFYNSDLQNEFNKIWEYQRQYYSSILTDTLKEKLKGKNKTQTWAICKEPFQIVGITQTGNATEKRLEKYYWRKIALEKELELEILAIVLQEINNQINQSSGYLGAISDRSKELYFNKQTVGQYFYSQLKTNPHSVLKNQVFYRQDYLDEFEKIWETQKQYHIELTDELKKKIRDIVIFYQRPLKSQKGLLSLCQFENWEQEVVDKTTGEIKIITVGHKVIPKSSPLFQEYKIWTIINNIEIKDKTSRQKRFLEQEEKELVFKELNIREKLSADNVLTLLGNNTKNYELNYKEIDGNRTNAELFGLYFQIMKYEGIENDFTKMKAEDIIVVLKNKFQKLGINTKILEFNSEISGDEYDKQEIMQLWHLLYSFTGDNSKTGNEKLVEKLHTKFGFPKDYAKMISSISYTNDYGSLSSKAIRKIIPFLKEGNTYDLACMYAGYNHSNSKTKEDLLNRELKNRLEILPKNSLRNPVVEKILNQMINVINAIIDDKELGKPDEIRIELARELKYSAKERGEMTKNINAATIEHEKIRKILSTDPFNISKVTKNDIIKYKLYKELETNDYKTIYTNTYIPQEKLFSKEVDIEHIIPKARIFDDSFSNKTLATRRINILKSDDTAYDFLEKYLSPEDFNQYLSRVDNLYKAKIISKAKYQKLLKKNTEIIDGFIDRDLRNSQYIAKKAKQILEEVARTVNTTTGSITERLRRDWQLIDIMKELNSPKYKNLGLTEQIMGKNDKTEERIIDWTKRNDHRHHAMDALTVAFTSYSHVQYLNNLNARKDEKNEKYHTVYGIEQKYLQRKNGNLIFNPPIPIKEFRTEAKKHLENILISFKAKNKVVTKNKNKIKGKNKAQITQTPRGELHKQTVYGKMSTYTTKEEKVSAKFDELKIMLVANSKYRELLLNRLKEFDNDPQKAFTGKNSLSKNPIYLDEKQTIQMPEKIKLVWFEDIYTIRKKIDKDLKLEKIIDVGVKNILQKRLDEYKGDAKLAFSNLDDNPIWLNKEKGIALKRVTITGVSNTVALHYKKDKYGKFILNQNEEKIPVDFVSTGNNHHVAIYEDENGNLQENIVSFYDAVKLRNLELPVINKTFNQEKDWKFLFSMKQNEYFVFPNAKTGFNPNEIDLLNPDNANIISPNLFRVQKIATKDYVFRHHLETTVEDKKELVNIAYKRIGLSGLKGVIKVRINHLGKIVHVGEY